MTKEEIQRVLDLSLEYYKSEVFGTGKESENSSRERIDWIYDKMKGSSEITKDLEEAAVDIADALLAKSRDYILSAEADYWNGAHDGIIAGAKWDREQMMKDGSEGEVRKDGTIGYLEFSNDQQFHSLLEQFQDCDKVRIIIVKED